jgi:hypothetical protein
MGELKKVLVHSCLKREDGFDEDYPLPPGCRCREWVSMAEAKQKVDDGEAQYVAAFSRVVDTETDCHICLQDPVLVRSCFNCNKTGIVEGRKTVVIRGENIVFISRLKKTPRTATVEKAHIERTNEGHKDEVTRTDIYNELTLEFFNSLGAWIIKKPDNMPKEVALQKGLVKRVEHGKFKQGKLEPEDDPKLHTGRAHDFGRPI